MWILLAGCAAPADTAPEPEAHEPCLETARYYVGDGTTSRVYVGDGWIRSDVALEVRDDHACTPGADPCLVEGPAIVEVAWRP